MRNLRLVALFAVLAWPTLSAQPHTDGVLIGGGYPGPSTNYLKGLFLVSRSGQFSTLVDTSPSPRPYYFQQTAMDVDNRSIVFGALRSVSPANNLTSGVFRYDPATLQFTTIVRSTVDFTYVQGVAMSQDGDWIVNANGTNPNNTLKVRVYRVGNSGAYSTMLGTMQLGHVQEFRHSLGRDLATGEVLLSGRYNVGTMFRPIYALADDGSWRFWNRRQTGALQVGGWSYYLKTGEMVYTAGRNLYRVQPGPGPTSMTSLALPAGMNAHASVLDNQSAASPLMIAYSFLQGSGGTRASLAFIDPDDGSIVNTVNFLAAPSSVAIPYTLIEMLHHRNRYIQTVKTGPRRWRMQFDLPAFPGKGYVAIAGISGVRPGYRVGGRNIWLNYDGITYLTLANRIRSIFDPGPLVLDGQGRAQGQIDLSRLSASFGITAHVLVGVIDPQSPGGLAFVTDPYPMQI